MQDAVIEPAVEGKGRAFHAVLLASVEADQLWAGGNTSTDNIRPVWAMFAGSDQELRAFVANLQMGRKANLQRAGYYRRGKEDRVEFLKSSGFQTIWQREEEGSLVTVFLPELFQMDPGMVDQEVIRFVLLPTQGWHKKQEIDAAPLIKHAKKCGYTLPPERIAELAATSFLFSAYLDRRTRCPLVADGRFYMQLMLGCLKSGAATFAATSDYSYNREEPFGVHPHRQYYERNTADVGLLPGIAFHAGHTSFEELLAQEVALFFKLTR
jgi:hypothetical protein